MTGPFIRGRYCEINLQKYEILWKQSDIARIALIIDSYLANVDISKYKPILDSNGDHKLNLSILEVANIQLVLFQILFHTKQ